MRGTSTSSYYAWSHITPWNSTEYEGMIGLVSWKKSKVTVRKILQNILSAGIQKLTHSQYHRNYCTHFGSLVHNHAQNLCCDFPTTVEQVVKISKTFMLLPDVKMASHKSSNIEKHPDLSEEDAKYNQFTIRAHQQSSLKKSQQILLLTAVNRWEKKLTEWLFIFTITWWTGKQECLRVYKLIFYVLPEDDLFEGFSGNP